MRQFLFSIAILLGSVLAGHAQSLDVRVLGVDEATGTEAPLEEAWVYAHATGTGAQTDADGRATISDTGGGLVSIQKPGWTAAVQTWNSGTVEVRLMPGDVTADGRVDLRDVAALVDYLGEVESATVPGTDVPDYHPEYDFNADGQIDRADLEIVAVNRGAEGDAAAYRLIDDGEDPDPTSRLPQGSFWQTLSDATFNGGNSTTTPSSLSRVEATTGGVPGSDYAIRYRYTLGPDFQFRFALLRVLMTADDGVGIDASAYAGIEFWLKGNGVPLVVSLKAGPTSDDFDEYEVRIDNAPEEWTRYRFNFEQDFRQPGFGQVEPIEAVVQDLEAIQFKTVSGEVGEEGEVWVDNLAFVYAGAQTASAMVTGQVQAADGAPVPFARVRLTSGVARTLLTDAEGRFDVDLPPGPVTVEAAKTGFETASTTTEVATGERADVTLSLARTVPAEKPTSTGPVRVAERNLETDLDGDGSYDPFFVQGVAFSVAPIGSRTVNDDRIYDRAAAALDTLHANTIRTYSGIDPYMLDRAEEIGVGVIVGYWVPSGLDLSDPTTRDEIIDDFRRFVDEYKDHPAVLMWTLGNEQNYQNGDNPYWYDLAQELAIAAYEQEGSAYHPVSINNGDIANIGDAGMQADDAALSYVDLWASNVYQPNLAATFFDAFRARSDKPVVLTEFGIDALDDRTKMPYEDVQADFDRANWEQILASDDVAVGGTVFEFTDEWWKAGDPDSHDFGGYPTGSHPDGFSNEEWWGLIAVTPDTDGDGLDEWRARPAYFTFQDLWRP